jgi:hypothetical protein
MIPPDQMKSISTRFPPTPLRVPHSPDCAMSAFVLFARPALNEASPNGTPSQSVGPNHDTGLHR